MATGTLYGLGIGPGDPELVTVKARRILETVPVIAYPAPADGPSLARAIADPHVPKDRTEIAIRTPMTPGRFPADDVYDRYAAEISGHLKDGRDVAVLCEGDPFLYGSFMYLFERLAGAYAVRVVPGVSSLGACAAVAGRPLVSRNQALTVLPAPLPEADLKRCLAEADAVAIMKVGRHLGKVRRVLLGLGLEDRAWYVARAGMADERIAPLADVADDEAPYFSMILVRRSDEGTVAGAAKDLPDGAALMVLGPAGLDLARTLKPLLPGAEIHGLEGRTAGADTAFADVGQHLRALFAQGRPIVGVMAAGIMIRALGPVLADKGAEPPVVALAADGAAAVPLLGGHRGANRLAEAIAGATGGRAAVTTAGDSRLGLALDDPPPGWRVANPGAAKEITRALLAGEPVALRIEADDAGWIADTGARFADGASLAVCVTDRLVREPGRDLVLHPPVLAVGVGCERGAGPEELIGLARKTMADSGLAAASVACVASLDLKADEGAVHAVAEDLGVPARFFTASELEAEAPRLANPSDVVFREVGCHGVAEGAALAAAGPESALAVEKRTSKRATCAIGRSPVPIDPETVGRGRGRLVVVGIGPGAAAWRTPEATTAILAADDVVGYRLYLDLIDDLIGGRARYDFDLAEEEARVRHALDLAAGGRRVALVSSGDAGIYALAALVFELLERDGRADWNRVEVSVAPGVSALQAAAARIGAPLGHDFCAVSLSDLMTPWPEIQRRLEAAAAGDFVVALYNPVSKRRRTQLARARDILLAARPPETPVVVARNLGREGETVEVMPLAELEPTHADMLTVVLVGSSRTRALETAAGPRIYTPRGYGTKAAQWTAPRTAPKAAARR
ncbi:MAG: precorrin-3B C(17)-methyltransferase [Rhodospirillales bacterium]